MSRRIAMWRTTTNDLLMSVYSIELWSQFVFADGGLGASNKFNVDAVDRLTKWFLMASHAVSSQQPSHPTTNGTVCCFPIFDGNQCWSRVCICAPRAHLHRSYRKPALIANYCTSSFSNFQSFAASAMHHHRESIGKSFGLADNLPFEVEILIKSFWADFDWRSIVVDGQQH